MVRNMSARRYFSLNYLVLLLLAGCVTAETRSIVSPQDLPQSRYRKLAIFVEGLTEAEQFAGEGVLVAGLRNKGINAIASYDLFMGQGELTPAEKGDLVRKQDCDGVLYVSISHRAVEEQIIENAWFDGGLIRYRLGPLSYGHSFTDGYIIKSDGRVAKSVMVLGTKSELQDTTTAKTVWEAVTSASGDPRTSSVTKLFQEASQQMVDKMRKDRAI